MAVVTFFRLLKAALKRWWAENTFRLGASLAYYTVISLAPTVLLAISIAGLVVEKQTARHQLLDEIDQTMGKQVGQAVETTLQYSQDTGTGVVGTVIGLVVLLFGASTVFVELQDDLNTIWGVRPREGAFWKLVKDRFWSFTVVLGIGFLLLVSLIMSASLSALSGLLSPVALPAVYLWQAINWGVSFALITLLFALIYKMLPDVEIAWSDVWVGAAVTAFLFSLGKHLIGIYLGQSSWVSAYGAAGSLVLLLLWVYYSSQIFLFGAEFTYVYARHRGKPLVPQEHAEPATEEAESRRPDKGPSGPQSAEPPREESQPVQGLVTTLLSALGILLVSRTMKVVDAAARKAAQTEDLPGRQEPR